MRENGIISNAQVEPQKAEKEWETIETEKGAMNYRSNKYGRYLSNYINNHFNINGPNVPIKRQIVALTSVAQWVGRCPAHRKVAASSIPRQGTRLGCRPGPWLGRCKRQLIDVSLAHQCCSPSLSPPL